jgi:hypothetical protein
LKKYYYTFRVVDNHNHISNPTPIYRVELVNNSGAIFPIVEVVDFLQDIKKKMPSKTCKKYIKIKPSFVQSMINEDKTGITNVSSVDGLKNVFLGVKDESVWGKNIKIRLVSKNTGKKVDINLSFGQQINNVDFIKCDALLLPNALEKTISGTITYEFKVKKVIDVSSDKAVEPINLYGMTKAVGEKIIIQANDLSDYTRFVCIRGGNVMGSSGSVIPLFIEQIKAGGPLTITDTQMTRFFLTLEEAIGLLFKASIDSIGGETFVMNMPACYIKDLAEVLMEEYGTVEVKETGIRPGEKLDEMLISHNESKLSFCYDDNYFLTLPVGYNQKLAVRYQNLNAFSYSEFSSKTKILSKPEIKEMLKKGRFL